MDALVAVDGLGDVQVALQAAQHVGVGRRKPGLGRDQTDHVAQSPLAMTCNLFTVRAELAWGAAHF